MKMSWIEASPCDHQRLLGSFVHASERERDWYERHERWFWAQLEHGTTRWTDEPAYAVNSALGWLLENAGNGEPRWDQLNVRELLLVRMRTAGLPLHYSGRDILRGLKEFITWMGEHNKLAARTACCLNAEIDACQEDFLRIFGERESERRTRSAREHLAGADDPGEVWLWCLHCMRFFQAKHLRPDFLGNRQCCPFRDCNASGLDVEIFYWETWRNWNDPKWPASVADLRHGRRAS